MKTVLISALIILVVVLTITLLIALVWQLIDASRHHWHPQNSFSDKCSRIVSGLIDLIPGI